MVFQLLCDTRNLVMANLRRMGTLIFSSSPKTLGTAATSIYAQSSFVHDMAIAADGTVSK